MTHRKIMAAGASALMIGTLSACAETQPPREHRIGMANPASVYCQKIGGRLEMQQGADGVRGICHLPDGASMEEWALFRRDHASPTKGDEPR
ncbi:putative hemolysin [Acetobacter sicerae]|uniref:putative hemolysin n=1 Tax=Acetobacter sicerae TaxID=85325 RepID=UPI00156B0D89|nr:DUF333 domain-containing protein [Acetobacter sicerae]NHN91843.1 DUF333 domain-containing protein [Acetobacter sicerae]